MRDTDRLLLDENLEHEVLDRLIHSMAELYPYEEVEGLQKTGRQWL